jgi:perosamine synthetase
MIPISEPSLEGRELEYVTDCIRSGWVSSLGEYVKRFEREFAAYCGVRYGAATHNGTVALHLALAALGVGPGDEVILPTLTFVATANAVVYTGATPVFVDSEPSTWNIDPAAAARAITPRTRAIIAVHLYGHPADMDPLRALADQHGLMLIEDAAEAHGARYKGQRVGSLSDVAVFSFFGNKIITTGEGGMVVTDDAALAERCFFLGNQARHKENPYWHPEIGYNYRMTNVQAALGVAQLERIEEFIAIRARNADHYRRRLSEVPGLSPPPCAEWAENVYWMYTVLVEEDYGLDRDSVMVRLRQQGIDTRPVFYPIHTLPMYNSPRYPVWGAEGTGGDSRGLPVAEELGRKGINLPSGATLRPEQVDLVCDALAGICQRRG